MIKYIKIVFFIFSAILFAEKSDSKVDSLLKLIDLAPIDKKVDYLYELSYINKDILPRVGIEYGTKGLKLAREANYLAGISKSCNAIGINYINLGEFKEASVYLIEALKYANELNDQNLLSMSYNNLGILYYRLDNFEKSVDYLIRAINIRRAIGDNFGLANSLNNIALNYYKIKEYKIALDYLTESAELKKQNRDTTGLVRTLSNIALIYIQTKRYDEANKLLLEAKELGEKVNYLGGLGLVLNYFGRLNFELGKYKIAREFFDLSKNYYASIESKSGVIENIYYMGKCYFQMKDYYIAEVTLTEALEKSYEINTLHFIEDIYKVLAELYYEKGEYSKSHQFMNRWIEIQDSLFNIEKAKHLVQLQIEMETEQKQKEIENQKRIISIQKWFLTIAILLIIIIIVFLILLIKVNKKKNSILKEKEEANLLLESTIEQLRIPFVLLNNEGDFKIINSACREFLGINRSIGISNINLLKTNKPWKDFEINGRELLFDELPVVRALKGESIENYEMSIKTISGKTKYILVTAAPIYDNNGNLIAAFVVFPDITQIKQMQNELEKLASELKEANDAKNKFLSIISHDLRGPFHAFLGYSDILAKRLSNHSDEDIRRIVKNLNIALQRQFILLEDLLNWSKLHSDKIKIEISSLKLDEEINKVLANMEHSLISKKITVEKDISPDITVNADRELLNLVIRNLLSNAIKFTPKDKKITINAQSFDSKVKVSIIDEGIGIPEEMREKLFRIDSAKSTKGTEGEVGSGLGLILCKEIIEKMNGEIWVESEVGKGSNFSFTLPS